MSDKGKMTPEKAWDTFHELIGRIRPIAKDLAEFAEEIDRSHLADSFTDWAKAWGWLDLNILYNCVKHDFGPNTHSYDPFSMFAYENEDAKKEDKIKF